MAPYVIRAPLQPRLTDDLFETVLHKVTNVSKFRKPVVVDLAANNLHLNHLLHLTEHFENTETRVFALDMAENRIQTDWAALNNIVDRLLGLQLVMYMDLGMNYLPPICSLEKFPAVKQNFLKFGQRLSLALDCDRYTGQADIDMWITNARTFKILNVRRCKREAYGITEFAEDPAEL